MSIQQDIVLYRVNPAGERIGILRELMGEDRWFFDCDECDVGSCGYPLLSKLVGAITSHNALFHKGFGVALSPEICDNRVSGNTARMNERGNQDG